MDVWRSATLPLVRQLTGLEDGLALKVARRGVAPGGGGEVHLNVPLAGRLPPVSMVDEGARRRAGPAAGRSLSPGAGAPAVGRSLSSGAAGRCRLRCRSGALSQRSGRGRPAADSEHGSTAQARACQKKRMQEAQCCPV